MRKEAKTISDLIGAVWEEMIRRDYKSAVLNGYRPVWNKLRKHAGERPADDFNMEFGMKFLDEVMQIHTKSLSERSKYRWMKAIYILADFKRTNIISLRWGKRGFVFSGPVKSVFEQYAAHQAAVGLSEAYRRETGLYLERFSKYLELQRLENVADLSVLHIHGFANSLAIYALPTIYHTLSALRRVLRYMHEKDMLADDLSVAVPRVPYSKKAKIPSAYTRDEIERMVRSIDRANPRGKRDYALILLAARLGLRASDITGITFDSIKWEKNIIEIVQQKTGETVVLPLLNDVGEAIIDYIRFARPVSESKALFLKVNAPNDAMLPNSIHRNVHARLKDAGISIPPGKKHGPHALRHSLASALLETNVPMPVISEALGHSDTESTSVYLKIDLAQLKSCALEVPDFLRGFLQKTDEAHAE